MLTYSQYDGVATVNEPPHKQTFDPAIWKSSLGPCNQAQSEAPSSTSASPSVEISALSAVSSLVSSVASFMRPDHTIPATPTFSNWLIASPVLDTPPVIFNTPSKLTCFLEAAEKNGIPGVQSYHAALSLKAYGPDILHLINNADLAEVGISPGDAIQLKEYASMWWMNEQRCVAKCP